jgi:hypothetical protein
MSGTRATRAKDATIARLQEQAGHAIAYRFEVQSAPSITFHLDPGPRDTWAITRFGWVTPVALTEHGWEPLKDTSDEDRFIWSVKAALAHVPGLLDEMSAEHAAWQADRAAREAAATRARAIATVAETAVDATRALVATVTAVSA